jgi:hypothetical protein
MLIMREKLSSKNKIIYMMLCKIMKKPTLYPSGRPLAGVFASAVIRQLKHVPRVSVGSCGAYRGAIGSSVG